MNTNACTIRRTVRGSLAAMRVDLLIAAQYRANMVMWSLASILQVVVYLAVWQAVAAASGGSAGGYSAAEFAGYFLVLLVVRDITYTWIPYELSGYVRSGKMSGLLLRPLHPIAYIGTSIFAFRVQSMLTVVPIAALLFMMFDAAVDLRAEAVVVALLVIPLAMATRFLADSLLSLASMWLTRIDGIRGMYYLLLLLLGGQFAPVDVLPAWLRTIALAMPFYWTLGYPTELLVGRAPMSDAWLGIAVLAAWTIGLYAVLQPAWRASTRAYEAVGS